ncbi:hypothetical protein ABL78_0838 [Leptomonas seymouri]|uniref:SURP motif domain-containing protein n=1 Tax=Leptomonas seymouri TaxID=5684 RepID=A0A0N1IBI0_LEPSE|nr:hypothetical protein ABL78_0838 [Leptomonas seymouri]|eukprot:KPI90085.1 hypothetical protein ABL78_0838 [Leptomonas seymouri]
MSCSLGTYSSTRQVAPASSVSALRAAAEQLQHSASGGANFDVRRPNYLVDVPVSAIDLDRWEKRWQEAKGTSSSSSSAAGAGVLAASQGLRAGTCFQSASAAYAARSASIAGDNTTTDGHALDGAAAAPTRHLAPFPPFVFASVKTLPMTQLLKLRRQWLPHRQRFPVHQQRMGFLDAVLNHAVVALVGAAGSGRTLQVPIVLSETEVLKRRRLVVVSANATAARLTVLRLREERGEDMQTSRTVAAALPNLVEVSESTSVVVTTAEVLLRQLLCDPCLEDVGCVVLDDAHLRSESTELCLALLRDLLSVQHQAEQQRNASTAASATGSGVRTAEGAQTSPDAAFRRKLHLVLNCPDEASASALLAFLAPSRCKATSFALQASSSLITASTTLYLEETVQWLLKCEKEGSCLVRDGSGIDGAGSTVETTLLSYAENVDAVARIMAAGDAEFTQPAAFRQYWLALIRECVDQYDKADRQARNARAAGDRPVSPIPVILIVAPNNHYVHVITSALREVQQKADEEGIAAQRVFTPLAEDVVFANFVMAAQRTAVVDANQRWIVVATSELSQTVLPSNLDIGLVVDCARSTYTPLDALTMADTCITEYSSIAQLRYRRRLAKVMVSECADAQHTLLAPFVIQLIPKSVLHSAQHRRMNADPAQHLVFRLPFHRYVQLYQALQAREEALLAQRAAAAASLGRHPNHSSGNDNTPTVASKIPALLSALLIGTPAATANKYEAVRRVMTSVESYLRASAHIAVDNEVGSITNGRLVLQPMGVLSLCLAVPLPVARLLVTGALLRPSVAALTAIGALWCCSNLLSLQGVGAVRVADASDATRETVEEQVALLNEARLFFSCESLSDVVATFHVYRMWCSVRGKPDAERDFLEECGVSLDVLTSVFETQVGLCAMLHSFGLLVPPSDPEGGDHGPISSVDRAESTEESALRGCIALFNSTAEAATELRKTLGSAMTALSQEASSSRTLHACVTAALYPSCVVPTGDGGIGLLYDSVPVVTAAVGDAASAGPAWGGRRVVSFAQDSVLADPGQGAKAAGKPFLFLAKAIADTAARDASGATSTATTAVVEQLNPLHEAAALVFCGHSYERPRKAPLRCRGWSSVLTKSWRETRRARGLPPVAQLPPTLVVVQSYDTVHCQQVVCTMDQNFSLTMRATTSRWLQQLRSHVRSQLTALVRGITVKSKHTGPETVATASVYRTLAAEVAEAWAWWERRHAEGREWLREERVLVARQQEQREEEVGDGKTPSSRAAAKAAALRQQLYGYYEWQLQPGAPATVVVPTSADRKAAAKSAAAAASAADATVDPKVADEDEEVGNVDGGLPATYTGKLPPADVEHIFRQCAKSMAAKGTREAEARLLRDSPEMFSFLNPEDPYHEYYLYLLRQAAPDMEVLGDNLEELINFLESVEVELREELGYTDVAATAADSSAGGVLGDEGQHGYNGGGGANMWGGANTGMYEVHDVVDEEGVDGGGDMYAGDGAGLQLESAAVNLKKNAGPTLAEQIEQAKRAQANLAATGAEGQSAKSGAATSATGKPAAVFPSTMPSASTVGRVSGAAATTGAAATPFVSTSSGETLADKLKAMQMAAMQGAAGASPGSVLNMSASYAGGAEDAHDRNDDQVDFVVPQPTAEDLLAAINFDSVGDAVSFAPTSSAIQLPQQQDFEYGGTSSYVSSSHVPPGSLLPAPTTEELMVLLGTAQPPPTGGVLGPMSGVGGGGGSVLEMLGASSPTPPPLFAATLPVNPLLRPPPAIPAKALEERPPSVLVYPIPNCRRHGGNVRLLLAKSLGEALNVRVGPTVIIGRVARIDVPNRNVEARALALKKFQCAEQTAFLLRNDRIIDDPTREKREQQRRREDRDQQAEAHHGQQRRRGSNDEGAAGHATDPTSPDVYADPSAYVAASPATLTAKPALRIGVLSSSEEEDDDSDSSSSSSSSSASLE